MFEPTSWVLVTVLTLNGVGTYHLDNIESKEQCITLARAKWTEFYKNQTVEKNLVTRCWLGLQKKEKYWIKCDYVGHCTIKRY